MGEGSQNKDAALRALLDDESPVVREAVRSELVNREDSGVGFLRELIRKNGPEASHARRYLRELGGTDTIEEFREFIRSFHYEIETGCVLMERAVYPDLDPSGTFQFLDHLAAASAEWFRDGFGSFEKCKAINRVVFHEYHFRGDRDGMQNPENSFLSQVIRRRAGIPISLSVLYLLVAIRCGVPIEPIGLPGHFLLGCFADDQPFFLDPFERGRFRTEEEVRQMILAREIEDAVEYLVPAPVGEILCRFCRNLVHQYTLSNDLPRAHLFAGFVRDFEVAYERYS